VNWINNVVRPKIRNFLTTKREVPDNLWVKCPETGQMVFYKDLEANQFVVPSSNYHMRMSAEARLKHLFDEGEYTRVPVPNVPHDPLKFRDGRRYSDRLKDARTATQLDDAVVVGEGKLDQGDVVAAAQDFRFMGGSLGMAAGEAVITGMLRAVEKGTPFILFAASGGARMQEGILSLMQMPRTTIAVQRLREARLPYIVVLTDPTTGGVTASYAMLGDIHIAEPGALICFAGPRVIQQTIREQLPEGFQRAEYLLAHGMIDMVVHRHRLRETLSRLCGLLMSNKERVKAQERRRQINGRLRGNGASLDGQLIEAAARAGQGGAVEGEPAEAIVESFDTTDAEAGEKVKRESDSTKSRVLSRDGLRGS
jgi:acetyl-CoA carboxylase carboxyl transferase subunit beta